MALTKKQRQQVWDKSGGRCWYCGSQLPERGWHADHVEPVLRNDYAIALEKRQQERDRKRLGLEPKPTEIPAMVRPKADTLDNIVPACAPCNLFKAAYGIEFFRSEIAAQIDRVRRASSGYRIAERMGIIEAKPEKEVVFWFEREGL